MNFTALTMKSKAADYFFGVIKEEPGAMAIGKTEEELLQNLVKSYRALMAARNVR